MSWWKRLKPNKANIATTVIASVICGAAVAVIWIPANDPARDMDRYGQSMAAILADTSAGQLLHADRINLAVVANRLREFEEISGVIIFDVQNKIVALSGSTDSTARYTAAATLDDTMTGSVSVFLDRKAFRTPMYWANWGLTLIALLLAPPATLGLLGFERTR